MNDEPGTAVWPVWLVAAPSEETERTKAAAANIERAVADYEAQRYSAALPDVKGFVGFLAVFGAFLVCIVSIVAFATDAVRARQTEVLWLLGFAHVPLAFGVAWLWGIGAEAKPETTCPLNGRDYPHPPRNFHAYALTRCHKDGVDLAEDDRLLWQDCRGFRFDGGDGVFFRITLIVDPQRLRQPDDVQTRWQRLRPLLPGIAGVLSLLLPVMLNVMVWGWGLYRYGTRPDVQAAQFVVLLNAVLILTAKRMVSGTEPCSVTKPARTAETALSLVFDSRVVSATEVLNRLGRHLHAR